MRSSIANRLKTVIMVAVFWTRITDLGLVDSEFDDRIRLEPSPIPANVLIRAIFTAARFDSVAARFLQARHK